MAQPAILYAIEIVVQPGILYAIEIMPRSRKQKVNLEVAVNGTNRLACGWKQKDNINNFEKIKMLKF